jgi:hypothetical protein
VALECVVVFSEMSTFGGEEVMFCGLVLLHVANFSMSQKSASNLRCRQIKKGK